MEFIFIDYSEIYFDRIIKQPKPVIRSGKFVQIINEETEREYIVLSPKELSSYHANIIERFCSLTFKINGSYQKSHHKKPTYFEIHDPEWIIEGGGMWNIDETTKNLNLYGESTAYGKFYPKGLKKKLIGIEKLHGFRILIDGF